MSTEQLQVLAGMTSTLIFVSSNLPMLYKAFRTRDMGSYSLAHIALSNIGNLLYWAYVAGLPVGPVWFLHGFFTMATALMLIFYLRYEKGFGSHSPSTTRDNARHHSDIRRTLELLAQPAYSTNGAASRTHV